MKRNKVIDVIYLIGIALIAIGLIKMEIVVKEYESDI